MKTDGLASCLGRALLFVGLAALLLLAFSPWTFWMPTPGLDSSWVAVLNEAFARKWKWGSELAFTYGPYGFLVLRQFHPGTWGASLIFWSGVSLIFSLVLWKLLRPLPILLAALLAWLFMLLLFNGGELFFYVIPVIVCLGFDDKGKILDRLSCYALACLSGIGGLIKFSYAPVPLVIYLLLDLRSLLKSRKAPLLTPLFLGTVLLAFFALNPSPGDFLDWLRLSNSLSSAYGAAMQVTGSAAEIGVFWAASLLILLSWVFLNRKDFFSAQSLLVFFSIASCCLIAQKAAFVRHDSHGLIAWNVLFLCSIFYWAYVWRNFPGAWSRVLVGGLCALNFFLYFGWVNRYFHESLFSFALSKPYYILKGNLGQLWRFSRSPCIYFDDQFRDYETALDQIKKQSGLGALAGSVDYIPSNQVEVMANRLDYRPRPIFQSYSAYAPPLIESNRRFFHSDRAPDNLIFGLDDIDGRYPGSSEGGSWLAFFERYDPVDLLKDKLLLRKRSSKRKVRLIPVFSKTLSFREKLDLQAYHASPLWMVARFEESALGVLVRTFFKSPILHATVSLQGGGRESYRIVPTLAEAGQLLSPRIQSGIDFSSLYFPGSEAKESRVRSLFFDTNALGGKFYSKVKVDFYRVSLSENFEHSADPKLADILSSDGIFRSMELLKGDFRVRPHHGEPIAFTHAPTDVSLRVPAGSKKLRLGFGMLEGSWQGACATDGVCFKVSSATDPGKILLEKCLDPRANPQDRAEVSSELPVSQKGGKLILSTACGASCACDWSYWTSLAFIK